MCSCSWPAELLASLVLISTALQCRSASLLSADSEIKNFYANSSSSLITALEAIQDYISNGSDGYLRLNIGSGTFHLASSSPNATALATFTNVSNISIIGAGRESTVVDGNGTAGFVFIDVHSMTIANITFTNCTSIQTSTSTNGSQQDNLTFLEFPVSLYLVSCSDVRIVNASVSQSHAVGLAMINVHGSNIFSGTDFSKNNFPTTVSISNNHRALGGGGVIIEFSFCHPGDHQCDITDPVGVSNATFEFTNCQFNSNTVSSRGLRTTSIYHHGIHHSGFGKGGGLAVYFRGKAINNSITLTDCRISGNTAESGGGLYVEFGDQSQGNTFLYTGRDDGFGYSLIDNNGPLCGIPSFNQSDKEAGGGGAMVLFMYYPPDPALWPGYLANVTDNHVEFRKTYFSANMACWGGGVAIVSSRANPWKPQTNTIQFTNCTFQQNQAVVSAALDISLLLPDTPTQGQLISPVIDQCVFHCNVANSRSKDSLPNIAGYQFGNGALYIDAVPTNFSGANAFTDNIGTALVVSGAEVFVTWNASILFRDNSGKRGGALVVMGGGSIITYPEVQLNFHQNQALELGGAIYTESQFGERNFLYSEKCFIRFYQPTIHPRDWNVTFNFSGISTGLNENSTIYLTSLLACVWPENENPELDIRRTLCWPGWVYDGHNAEDMESCSEYISTAPASFTNSFTDHVYHMSVYPRHKAMIPVKMKDDYGHIKSPVVFQLTSCSTTVAKVEDRSVYVTDNIISVYGVPNATKKHDFFLETLGPRVLSTVLQVTILPCPPGYTPLYDDTDSRIVTKCKCAYSLYFTCNTSEMSAEIVPGNCVKYSSEDSHSTHTWSESTHQHTMMVVNCPATVKYSKPVRLPSCNGTCDLEKQFCHEIDRNGTFCSGCTRGSAVDVNDIHDCVECRGNEYRYGWFLYVLTNILPITLFFIIVSLFKISATSAPMYAFVFFAQITTVRYFHNQLPWIFGLSEKRYFLHPLLLSFYAIWNLDFFIFKNVICLSPDLTTMYSLLLKYLLALYPMLLILLSYVCIELYGRNFRLLVWLWSPFRACLIKYRRNWQPKTSIIDAFATFLMISYTKIAFITISLLTPAQKYYVFQDSQSKVPDGYVFYFDPEYRYFKGPHLPLGLLALVIGVVFVLAPPTFLFLYPTRAFQRCLNRWSSRCSWQPVHTFADAFQGCFKNRTNNNHDYRYFSGLYLVLRIVILVIYAVESSTYFQLLLQQILCILAVLLFALVKPYKEPFYNKVDLTIFSLLSIMNSLSFTNFTYSCVQGNGTSDTLFAINYALGFLPLIYITVYVVYLLLKWCGVIVTDPLVKELTAGKSTVSLTSEESSTTADVPDRLLHPENYTDTTASSILSPNSSSAATPMTTSTSDNNANSNVKEEDNRGRRQETAIISRGRPPRQRVTEGSYFLKKAQSMKNYSSIN